MSKLTPTTIILLIAALGAAVLLAIYYRKKKVKKADNPTVETASKPAPNEQKLMANRGIRPMRLVKTPVGFMTAG